MTTTNKIIIGTHNSISYKKPKNFLGKLIRWTSQCQWLPLEEQVKFGVQAFDLRVRFKKGKPVLCHGLVDYDGNIYDILQFLNNQNRIYYVRLVLESFLRKPSDYEKDLFNGLCSYAYNTYSKLKFRFIIKKPWTIIEDHICPPVEEMFKSPSTLLEVLRGPKRLLYHQDENIKNIRLDNIVTKCIYYLDYVGCISDKTSYNIISKLLK